MPTPLTIKAAGIAGKGLFPPFYPGPNVYPGSKIVATPASTTNLVITGAP